MGQWDLSLPKSNIHVCGDELLVYSADKEEVIARHSLDGISSVRITKSFEPVSLAFAFTGLLLIVAPLLYVDGATARWVLVGFGVAFVLIAILGAIGIRLIIDTHSGEIFYSVNDLEEHARGFALTLSEMLTGRKNSEDSAQGFSREQSSSADGEMLQ